MMITDLMLWKLKIIDLTVSNSCVATYLSTSSLCIWWTALHILSSFGTCLLWPLNSHSHFPHPEQFLPHAGHLFGSFVFLQYLHLLQGSLLPVLVLLSALFLCPCFFMALNSFSLLPLLVLWGCLCLSSPGPD